MIIARTLLAKLRPHRASTRELQEQNDLARAVVLTGAFDASSNERNFDRSLLQKEVEALSAKDLKVRVQSAINRQVVNYFDIVHRDTLEMNAQPCKYPQRPTPVGDPNDYGSLLVPNFGTEALHDEVDRNMRERIRAELGYCPVVRESTLPSAGLGLFVEGAAPEGALVAIYPGLVHLPENLCQEEYRSKLLPDEDFFLMARSDGCVVDARSSPGLPSSPLTVAQSANHPPGGTAANVLQSSYDFPSMTNGGVWGHGGGSFPEHLRPLIPNRLYNVAPRLFGGKIDRWALVETVVLLAARDIQDEEVFMNYRFNPAMPAPAWYIPVDGDEARRRWTEEEVGVLESLLRRD
ncbi:unnamed protein product [Choristocarpus tenellus]